MVLINSLEHTEKPLRSVYFLELSSRGATLLWQEVNLELPHFGSKT